MRSAVLLVDHGSRVQLANQLIGQVAEALRARHPDLIIEIAHMEIASPTISEGVARCVAAGAQEITIHPYFLGHGKHTEISIPDRVAEARRDHPDILLRITAPLGLDDRLIDVVESRIAEAQPHS